MNPVQAALDVFRKLLFLAVLGLATVLLIGPVLALVAALFSVVFALVSALVPFALVGFLVWAVLQVLTTRPSVSWHRVRHGAARLYQTGFLGPIRAAVRTSTGLAHAGSAAGETAARVASLLGRILAVPLAIALAVAVGLLRGGRRLLIELGGVVYVSGAASVHGACGMARLTRQGIAWGCRMGQRLRDTTCMLVAVCCEALCGAAVGGFLAALSDPNARDPVPLLSGAALGALLGVCLAVSRRRLDDAWKPSEA